MGRRVSRRTAARLPTLDGCGKRQTKSKTVRVNGDEPCYLHQERRFDFARDRSTWRDLVFPHPAPESQMVVLLRKEMPSLIWIGHFSFCVLSHHDAYGNRIVTIWLYEHRMIKIVMQRDVTLITGVLDGKASHVGGSSRNIEEELIFPEVGINRGCFGSRPSFRWEAKKTCFVEMI